jgi:two-component system, OmpR family, response regulator
VSSPLTCPATRGTVLVVDDEAMLRHLLSRTLSEAGFDVVEAENGEAALRAASRCRASLTLVVTDISMPVMGGIEFARQFRPLYPRVPILFITGREADSRPGPGLTEDDLLLKPFGPDDLLSTVSRILARENREGRSSA